MNFDDFLTFPNHVPSETGAARTKKGVKGDRLTDKVDVVKQLAPMESYEAASLKTRKIHHRLSGKSRDVSRKRGRALGDSQESQDEELPGKVRKLISPSKSIPTHTSAKGNSLHERLPVREQLALGESPGGADLTTRKIYHRQSSKPDISRKRGREPEGVRESQEKTPPTKVRERSSPVEEMSVKQGQASDLLTQAPAHLLAESPPETTRIDRAAEPLQGAEATRDELIAERMRVTLKEANQLLKSGYIPLDKLENIKKRLLEIQGQIFSGLEDVYFKEWRKAWTAREITPVLARIQERENLQSKLINYFTNVKAEILSFSAGLLPEMRDEYVVFKPSLEEISPSKLLLCTTEEQLQSFHQKALDLKRQVDTFKDRLIHLLSLDLGVTTVVAKKIFRGAQTSWRGFFEELPNGLLRQTHGIKHLKICKVSPSGQVLALFGKNTLGSGARKRAKNEQQIGFEDSVRLTSLSKGQDRGSLDQVEIKQLDRGFQEDITTEVHARQLLAGVQNITELSEIHYVNQRGKEKVRYIMKKYEGDLTDLVRSRDPKNWKALRRCMLDVFHSISNMHDRNLIHGDLKLGNVLYMKGRAYVNDFDFLETSGASWNLTGSLYYMAPETFIHRGGAVYGKEMDVFSLGFMLLMASGHYRNTGWYENMSIIEKKYQRELASLPERIKQLKKDKELFEVLKKTGAPGEKFSLETRIHFATEDLSEKLQLIKAEYQKVLESLRSELAQSGDPLKLLICDLIKFEPSERPTCAQAEEKLQRIPI